MVNFGLPVSGTPANFNGFRVLAALLHGSQVVGVSQTAVLNRGRQPMFGKAAITLGIGPHSSFDVFANTVARCFSPLGA